MPTYPSFNDIFYKMLNQNQNDLNASNAWDFLKAIKSPQEIEFRSSIHSNYQFNFILTKKGGTWT